MNWILVRHAKVGSIKKIGNFGHFRDFFGNFLLKIGHFFSFLATNQVIVPYFISVIASRLRGYS